NFQELRCCGSKRASLTTRRVDDLVSAPRSSRWSACGRSIQKRWANIGSDEMQTAQPADFIDHLLQTVLAVDHHQAVRAQIRKHDIAEEVVVAARIIGIVSEAGCDLLQQHLNLCHGRDRVDEVGVREIVDLIFDKKVGLARGIKIDTGTERGQGWQAWV